LLPPPQKKKPGLACANNLSKEMLDKSFGLIIHAGS